MPLWGLRQQRHARIMLRMSEIATTPPSKPVRRKVDWDAVERDYRATSLTLRELAAKHGCGHSAIANRVTRNGWTRDLSGAVRSATSTMLIEAAVSGGVTKAVQDVTNAVLVTASVNTQVILSHRTRLAALHEAVDAAKHKLMQLGDEVSDIREAATFVQAVGNLAGATKTLIEQERKAFGLDDEQDDPAKDVPTIRVEYVGVTNA